MNEEEKVLKIIKDYYQKNGKSITVQQIQGKLGDTDFSVRYIVNVLRDAGKINRLPGLGFVPVFNNDKLIQIAHQAFKPIRNNQYA